MEKYALLILLNLIVLGPLTGQTRSSKKPYYVNIDIKKKDRITVQDFGKIFLQDCRIDTADMGESLVYIKEGYSKLAFQNGLETTLNKGLEKIVVSENKTDTLYININDFWFQEENVVAGWAHAAIFNSTRLESRLYVNADFYISNMNGLKKTGNLDTMFKRYHWLPDNCDQLTENAMQTMVLAAQSFNDGLHESVSREQFVRLSRNSVLPAIVRDTNYVKGVYTNFQQFLDNNPENISFTTKSLKKSTFLIYKAEGDTTNDEAWGFSDGRDVYIHLDSTYYLLRKWGHKFLTSAPLTIDIINNFATRALKRTLNTSIVLYHVFTNPFALFFIGDDVKRYAKKEEYFKIYELNLCNGSLR